MMPNNASHYTAKIKSEQFLQVTIYNILQNRKDKASEMSMYIDRKISPLRRPSLELELEILGTFVMMKGIK